LDKLIIQTLIEQNYFNKAKNLTFRCFLDNG